MIIASLLKLVAMITPSCTSIDGRPVAGLPPLIQDMTFGLKPGSRCLLLGGNGAGKASLFVYSEQYDSMDSMMLEAHLLGKRFDLISSFHHSQTTLLKIIGGKHMVPHGSVNVLGRPPFHDTNLTVSGDLSYVGGTWTRDVAFAGCSVPLTVRV